MNSYTDKPSILIAGHTVIDHIIDESNQVVPRTALGGPTSYSSVALRSLGYRPELVTRIGSDFPESFKSFLFENAGYDIEDSVLMNNKTTAFKIDRTKNPRRMWLLAKCRNLSTEDFEEQKKRRVDAFIVNTVAGEISFSLLESLSKNFQNIFVDSQGFVRRFEKNGEMKMRQGMDISPLFGVKFLKASRRELSAWTGTNDTISSIIKIGKVVRYLILTAGPGSAEIYEKGKLRWRVKPPLVKVNDTTGAGDIFLATFAAIFSESKDISNALVFASCAASSSIERIGIEKSLLERERIEQISKSVDAESF